MSISTVPVSPPKNELILSWVISYLPFAYRFIIINQLTNRYSLIAARINIESISFIKGYLFLFWALTITVNCSWHHNRNKCLRLRRKRRLSILEILVRSFMVGRKDSSSIWNNKLSLIKIQCFGSILLFSTNLGITWWKQWVRNCLDFINTTILLNLMEAARPAKFIFLLTICLYHFMESCFLRL